MVPDRVIPAVEYRNVHKTFGHPVLSGVDLTVQKGETISIVGASGTGKSVLLKTTLGLIVPEYGDVLVDGDSVFVQGKKRSLSRVRRKAGYVFQNAALFDSMSVYENVGFGLPEEEARTLPSTQRTERIAEALENVNLDPRQVFTKLPSQLSGGMRKRVGIARAIVGRPEILLYDEPVTGLDPVNSTVVHELIARLANDLRVTSIIVTHDIEGTLPISDRMAMLDQGVIRFVGTPDDFRRSRDLMVRAFMERTVLPDFDSPLSDSDES